MADLPRKAAARTARLAALPLGYAGRTAIGFGKRIGGAPADAVMSEIQQRTAEQLFRTLGELKGGAMKFGQALSVLESALPEEMAAPYREQLTKLQDSAPPMPTQTVRDILAEDLGEDWKQQLVWLDGAPTAAASIGQVHEGTWYDGRRVAVKVQYPNAGDALLSDLRTLARAGLAHGDLSPYNLLVHDGRVVLIDLPQVVDLAANPQGPEFLRRDCTNVCAWFARRGLASAEFDLLFGDLMAEAVAGW